MTTHYLTIDVDHTLPYRSTHKYTKAHSPSVKFTHIELLKQLKIFGSEKVLSKKVKDPQKIGPKVWLAKINHNQDILFPCTHSKYIVLTKSIFSDRGGWLPPNAITGPICPV